MTGGDEIRKQQVEFIDNECEAIKDSIIANYSGAYNSIENETGRVNFPYEKILLTFGAAALALSSFAYERILFTQNFGTQIFEDAQGNSLLGNGVYTVSFEFCLPTLPNKNTDSEITLFTNHVPISNATYRLPRSKETEVWENFVLDISQIGQDNTSKTMQVIVNAPHKPSLQYCVVEDNSDNTKYFDGLEIFDNARHVGIIKHGTPSQVFALQSPPLRVFTSTTVRNISLNNLECRI